MILFFVPSLQSGGTESVVFRYSQQLVPFHAVRVFSIVKNNLFQSYGSTYAFHSTDSLPYRILSFPLLRPLFYIYIFCAFAVNLYPLPSSVFCFGELPILISAPFALFSRCVSCFYPSTRFISSFRNDPSTLRFFKKYVLGLLLSCYHLSTTNSFQAVRSFASLPFCLSPVIPLLNPLPQRFIPRCRPRDPSKIKCIELLSISRLEPQKNVSALLEFFRHLNSGHSLAFRLTIVGEGSELEALKDLSEKYGLQDNVAFMGSLSSDEVSLLMTRSDAFLHFSLWDGIPNTVLEALSHSLPVFAFDSPNSSLSDLLVDFSAPIFLFKSFSPSALVSAFGLFMDECIFSAQHQKDCHDFFVNYSKVSMLEHAVLRRL